MRILFALIFLVGCGGKETVFVPVATQQPEPQSNYPQEPFPPEPAPLPEDEGQDLYLAKCSPCHGKNPDIVGADAVQIKEALRTVRQMFNVKASSAEQQKIGIFLTDLARGNGQTNPGEGEDDDDGDRE